MDPSKVLEALRASKSKKANYAGAARRMTHKRRKPKSTFRLLGKTVGHCPYCALPLVEIEVNSGSDKIEDAALHCPKCDYEVWESELTDHGIPNKEYHTREPWGNRRMPHAPVESGGIFAR